jgi:hypothetical protein
MEQIENSHRVIACPHILSLDRDKIDVSRPSGGSVSHLLQSIGWTDRFAARVYLDGELVPDARWEYTLPQAGQSLVIRAIPMGGGENGKTALRIVAMIAVFAGGLAIGGAPAFAAGGLLAGWGGAVGAAISIIGTLAVTAKIPPSLPRLSDQRQVTHD